MTCLRCSGILGSGTQAGGHFPERIITIIDVSTFFPPTPPPCEILPQPMLLKGHEVSQTCRNDKRTVVTKYKSPYFMPLRSFLGDDEHVLQITETKRICTPFWIHSARILDGNVRAAKICHSPLQGPASAKACCHQSSEGLFVFPKRLTQSKTSSNSKQWPKHKRKK